jgi:Catalytic LigB subunit of aromatic ring-opening dioxygenase
MARIIGGIGTSHVPTIGIAYDKGKQEDPDWKPLFRGYEPVAKWLAEKKPDVLFFCFNDHATTFFFDHYPTFALGVSDKYRIADEGLGVRNIPPLRGHAALARHIATSLVNEEFDLTLFQDLPW